MGSDWQKQMRVSPSKISDYRDCPRKYWFKSVACVPAKKHPSAARGGRVHKMIEEWELTGKEPNTEDWEIAQAIIEQLVKVWGVKPPLVEGQVEDKFRLVWRGWPDCNGKIDLFLPPVQRLINPWAESWRTPGEVPEEWWADVIDHKTTASWKWAKTEEQLMCDAQAVIYSTMRMKNYPFVRFSHVYGKTKGATTSKVVSVYFTPAILRPKIFNLYNTEIRSMVTTNNYRQASDVPYNVESCGKYGGCPFRNLCAKLGVNPCALFL